MTRDLGLLLLRMTAFYLALSHGWGKVAGLASGTSHFPEGVAALGFPLPVVFAWAAALAEFAGGLGVGVGLLTRWAAASAAFTMGVAAFLQHHALGRLASWLGLAPASEETLKSWGSPELALVYLAVFVAIALLGPGRFSIDARLGRK